MATMTPMTPVEKDLATIPALFEAAVRERADRQALGVIQNGQLNWQTWGQIAEKVAAWAAELSTRGVRPGDRVAQLSGNCEKWILADLAIQSIGAVHVPLHVSLGQDQIAQQVAHSGAKLIVVSPDAVQNRPLSLPADTQVLSHDELHYSPEPPCGLARSKPQPDDLATILYTSGTTGPPRGVMLTQRNIASNAIAMADALATDCDETRVLLLPLSHIYARTCDLYCWLYRGTRMVIAESRETALRDCRIAQPTVINAVPYFYQKVADLLRSTPSQDNRDGIREFFGGVIEMLYSGGAPLAPDVELFFAEHGLPILCGYGLSEASPVISASTVANHSMHSVGRPLPNVEVRFADDGEIQVRGPSVMRGYWQNPADTELAIQDGWLNTGDLGQWDAKGNLRIVGRKKEMLVLATGKKVAPTRVEQLLCGSPLIDQCCVLGDGRKCLAALIVPNTDALERAANGLQLNHVPPERQLVETEIFDFYREEIDRRLAGAADFEQIGPFRLLPRPFSLEQGELTPKQSLCRKAIEQNYAEEICGLYSQTKAQNASAANR
jgi:long-chain acyl-CoA synthetase